MADVTSIKTPDGTVYTIKDAGAVRTAQGSGNEGKVLRVNQSGNLAVDSVAELPSVSSSDNGKILQVVSGVWSVAQLPSASGVSF